MRLLEQAVHLLRRAPLDLLPAYYIGSLPFVLGFLYFWSDMSRSADARGHADAAALAMALLFVWMKTWQAVFAARVLARLCGEPPPSWPPARLAMLIAGQTLLQATGLAVLPLALLMTLPFGWCYAFYQNLTALGGRETSGLRELWREAFHQAGLWPAQNYRLLGVLLLFSLVVCIDLAIFVYLLPYGAKTLFGFESLASLQGFSLLNTTFAVAIIGLTFLCVDPLVKTVYALRCFDGAALVSGEDIRVDLKRTVAGRPASAVLLIALLLTLPAPDLAAKITPATAVDTTRASGAALSPQILDRSIQRVLKRSEFSWRLPRSRPQSGHTQASWLANTIQELGKRIAAALKTGWEWLKRLGRWIRGLFGDDEPVPQKPSAPGDWMFSVRGGLALLAALVLCLGAILLWKARQRRSPKATTEAAAAPVPIDLEDESIRADALPSERWLALAAELLLQRELRQALRAFFLATLAQLSEQGLITIQNYKSNRDYVRELGRRAHTRTGLAENFRRQAARFDSVWYGLHPATEADIRMYATLQERITGGVESD